MPVINRVFMAKKPMDLPTFLKQGLNLFKNMTPQDKRKIMTFGNLKNSIEPEFTFSPRINNSRSSFKSTSSLNKNGNQSKTIYRPILLSSQNKFIPSKVVSAVAVTI